MNPLSPTPPAAPRIDPPNGQAPGRPEATRGTSMRYRDLFDFAPDGYLVTDLQGVILEANHAAAHLLQSRKEFLIDKPLALFVGEGRRATFYSLLLHLKAHGGTVRDVPTTLRPMRGPPIETPLSVTCLTDEYGQFDSLRWLLRDVRLLDEARRGERAERGFSDSLLNTAQAAVLVLDARGHVLRTNPYPLRAWGYAAAELEGQNLTLLLPEAAQPEARNALARASHTGQPQQWYGELLARDGRCRWIAWGAKRLPPESGDGNDPETVLLVGHDITELRQAQAHVVQADRMASLGREMAGLVHESRNLLQRSQACLERAIWRLGEQPEALSLVRRALGAQRDLAYLFEDIRAYAVPLQLDLVLCDLAALYREAWGQVVEVRPAKPAALVEDDPNRALWCRVDRLRLLQVFRNIMENSFAACPHELRMEVRCREGKHNGRRAFVLSFRDNGTGMNPEQRRRLFEPFFTTRPAGSGLGMTIAQRIVAAHGGELSVGEFGPPGAEMVVTIVEDGT